MKAAYIEKTGAPDEIRFGDLAEPTVGAKQVLVAVDAVAIDPVDTYIRKGSYKLDLPLPFIVGRDMVGQVKAVGSGVSKFKVGDRVWANNQGYSGRQGTFAETLSIDEELLYALPKNCKPLDMVATVHSALTALVGLITKAQIQPGQTLFINGGSGNVGIAATQLAKHLGARVAVTAGSDQKTQWCKDAGADCIINYKTDDVADSVRKFAPSGVNVFWDLTRTPNVDQAVELTAHRGSILLSAGVGSRSEFGVGMFYAKNLTAYGFTITDLTCEELAGYAVRLNELMAHGVFKAHIEKIMKLEETAEAHRMIENTDVAGKIIIEVRPGALD